MMATCKDCIHYDACMDYTTLKESEFAQNFNGAEVLCDYFKNKADVAEVKRGKWEICCDGYYPYCSVCKAEPKNGVMSNYCPNCGADMRPLDKTLDKN